LKEATKAPRQKLSAYDQAAKLLGARPHFRKQLHEKLARRGYENGEIEVALDHLTSLGYLDDAKLAAQVATDRATRAGEGARRVRAELLRRGADEGVIADAITGAIPTDDREAALETARRHLARGGPRARDPIARYLDRKGFSERAILRALRELVANHEIPEES
jgi:regulatory protein